ncbi:uncharacterized protein LOC128581905 isoform X2 [Nycticebus coucang]|uniref:uncharacterized protein LOC128581905 isoform X2 n=1 Tax=Nycticebus coucang TaxID=9470 RepID=UPI00234D804D|nr:uncharacterized protein LOC128581905 isoform X2 [Nycticebus coucang]
MVSASSSHVSLFGLLITFMFKYKACCNSDQVERKYNNVTQTMADEESLKICNRTVENLKMVKTQCKELEGVINRLNLTLQNTQEEVDQLKKENEHLRSIKSKDNYELDSGISMGPGQLLLLLLLLVLRALLL